MPTRYQQCQTQLELERVVTTNKVRQLTGPAAGFISDPVSRQLLRQMQDKLQRIEAAQARFSRGRYGLCQICQRPIEPERLELFPYTEHCAACQRATERRVLRGTHQANQYSSPKEN